MRNPLLSTFNTLFEVPPFHEIHAIHYQEAIDIALEEAKSEIQDIIDNPDAPTFKNVIEALEDSGGKLERNAVILFNLNAAETNDEIQKITQDIAPKLSAFDSEVKQNEDLFAKVKILYASRKKLDLNREQKKLLKRTYIDFVRRGAELGVREKERFKVIRAELSKLSLKFSENVLAETNSYELIIDNEDDLGGIPGDVKQRAATFAKEKGYVDKWVFTLQFPSYLPFMEYADNRTLREKMYRSYMHKCFKSDDRDNQEIVLKMIRLKAELAELLGYPTFAHYILEERMAKDPLTVKNFLNDLLKRSLPKAREEVEEIKAFMKSKGVDHELQRWDWAYYSEKLKKEQYEFDDESVKPYFKLENVIEGAFKTADRLYGIAFEENGDIPVYHKDVTAYKVKDERGEVIAILLMDYFPRKGKNGGAWMSSYRHQKKSGGKRIIPHVSIVCNFTPSSQEQPSLLKFFEVKTLFHEFGHALHAILSDTQYQSLSGVNVYWDFVELPSQIMENWCYEKECLNMLAWHHQTGELIPEDLIVQIKRSMTYHGASATIRQLGFGLLDMGWHSLSLHEANKINNVNDFERLVLCAVDLFQEVENTNMSVQFSHIFASGYASGYYSYKWAEVLDADAFSLFLENGIFDRKTAASFRKNILSRGGTAHPMQLYKKFRGQKPSIDPLLKRSGLISDE